MKAPNNNVYGVILAGGSGERLWPLSTVQKPKQFLAIQGNKTLLSQTFARLCHVVQENNIWITTAQTQVDSIYHVTPNVFSEPEARNTAAAILFSCFKIYKKDPDAIIIFLPADHYIPESYFDAFADSIEKAVLFSQNNSSIVLLGVKPNKPATGYGYIEFDGKTKNNELYKVQLFHEKPSLKIAKEYLKHKTMLWNAGIFCGKASVFFDEYKKHAPEIWQSMNNFIAGTGAYNDIPSISIDHAVMEKSECTWVLPVNFDWYDVGTIEAFLSLKNNDSKEKVISVDAHNNLVEVPNKLVALVGVDDLCVVEVDNALLIIKRNQVEQVRSVVQNLKAKNEQEYL